MCRIRQVSAAAQAKKSRLGAATGRAQSCALEILSALNPDRGSGVGRHTTAKAGKERIVVVHEPYLDGEKPGDFRCVCEFSFSGSLDETCALVGVQFFEHGSLTHQWTSELALTEWLCARREQ